jgi:hypothetical protein
MCPCQRQILGAELRFPSVMNAEARSICRGLLIREPTQRLGYRGAHEIKAHPFFAPLDMDAVLAKQVEPPFKPRVTGEDDTGNVDKTFTAIPAAVTPTPADSHLSAAAQEKQFDDFTFVATSVIDGGRYSVSFDDLDEFEQHVTGGGGGSLAAISEKKDKGGGSSSSKKDKEGSKSAKEPKSSSKTSSKKDKKDKQ